MNTDTILPLVHKPSRYGGNEYNAVRKDWAAAAVRVALVFPDLYEIGMSHQGLQILYHIINRQRDMLAERVYAPDRDLEELLKEKGAALFSLESHRPLAQFDLLGITLPYELCYTNILTILDLAGIPFRAADRSDSHPLVVGGGPCAFHPEPVADFFDAILLGDGEEAILEITDIVKGAKQEKLDRAAVLARLSEVRGVYIPSFFVPRYAADGRFQGMAPQKTGYERVRRRILADLDSDAEQAPPPIVPLTKIVHDRLGVEIARGCTRGCRFCQAGVIYRPVRERSPEKVYELARAGLAGGGFEELALLSLSTGDYSCLADLLVRLMDSFAKEHVSVSMPSMRVGTLTPQIMEQIRRVRKTGFTLAPEAGTDRLRRVINKGITEADLLKTCRSAFALGWKLIKLYFMFGLPTESAADLQAMPGLARKVLAEAPHRGCRINVSAATFVPKPHTPFEREPQLSIAEGFDRIDFLKRSLGSRAIKLKWHDPRQSFLEGVLSRGDRRLSRLIEAAWRQGARLDAWSDHFQLELWQQAGARCGIELAQYLRRRDRDEILPWQHLDVGVDPSFFETERDKARDEVYTPDCRVHGCQQCGVCDFKTLQPVVQRRKGGRGLQPEPDDGRTAAGPAGDAAGPHAAPAAPASHHRYRLTYSRLGEARFLSHLELMQVFFRAFRRAKLPLHFSQGFNPSPRVSFSPALPLGTESRCENLWVDLKEPLADPVDFKSRFNRQLPPGIALHGIAPDNRKEAGRVVCTYEITLQQRPLPTALDEFCRRKHFVLSRERKGKKRELDARPYVKELTLTPEGRIRLLLISEPGKAGVKPMELLAEILALSEEERLTARVVKLDCTPFPRSAAQRKVA